MATPGERRKAEARGSGGGRLASSTKIDHDLGRQPSSALRNCRQAVGDAGDARSREHLDTRERSPSDRYKLFDVDAGG